MELKLLATPIPLLKYIILDENGPKSRWNVENPFKVNKLKIKIKKFTFIQYE